MGISSSKGPGGRSGVLSLLPFTSSFVGASTHYGSKAAVDSEFVTQVASVSWLRYPGGFGPSIDLAGGDTLAASSFTLFV